MLKEAMDKEDFGYDSDNTIELQQKNRREISLERPTVFQKLEFVATKQPVRQADFV